MRHLPSLLVIACVLATGGWVCQSNADNRCPGALTCDIDVANVCCPFGSSVWCGACAPDASGCTGETRTCSDLARVLECSFSAKIETSSCASRASQPDGRELWTIEATGTVTGCGEEVAFFGVDGVRTDVDCGPWSAGTFGGCIPPEDDTSTMSWTFMGTADRQAGDTTPVEIVVMRGHGTVPFLARAEVDCSSNVGTVQ